MCQGIVFCLLFSFLSASPLLPILLEYIWLSLHWCEWFCSGPIFVGAEVEVETNFCVYCDMCNFAAPEECGCFCVRAAFL